MTGYQFKHLGLVWYRLLMAGVILSLLFGGQFPLGATNVQAAPQAALTNTITLAVISARTEARAFGGAGVVKGDPILNFKYIININFFS